MTQEEKLKRLLDIFDPDTLTKEEFVKSFENVVKLIKKIEKKNLSDLEEMKAMFDKLSVKINNDSFLSVDKLKKESKTTIEEYLSQISDKYAIMEEALNKKISETKNGKDADEEMIVDKVLEKIELPEIKGIEEDLPKLGNPIRDALELLQGDERLSAEAISGLEKYIKNIIKDNMPKRATGGVNYGALNIHFADDETPVGNVDGSNTEFTISLAPNPASSLKVFMNGQRMKLTEDYTFSGNTITFVNAPLTGSIITCDYRQ